MELPRDRLDAILARHAVALTELATNPDPARAVSLAKEVSELEAVVAAIAARAEAQTALEEARALIADPATDAGLRMLAEEEIEAAGTALAEAERAILIALLPRDAADARGAILEIRAGTGGDEAALFAGDLARMYERYAALKGWRMEVLSESPGTVGGFKEIIAEISGAGVFGRLKYESGVHRVQRVPDTEASAASTPLRRQSPSCRWQKMSMSASTTPICASTPCGRAARAASMSTKPNRRCASRISPPASSWWCRMSARSTRTAPAPWRS